jgi:hypothetical protein
LKKANPAFNGSCQEWYGTYLAGIQGAVRLIPDKVPPGLESRAHQYLANYAYQSKKLVDAQDKKDFFDSVQIPPTGTSRGDFLQAPCNHVFRHLIEIWSKMWQAWQARSSLSALIPDWDLNTGIDRGTGSLAFWP